MAEVFLVIVVLCIFVLGFYITKQADNFFETNYKRIQSQNDTKEPVCVMLPDDLPDEEILQEIHRFRKKHQAIEILIYDDTRVKRS